MRFPTIFRRRVGEPPNMNHENRLWWNGDGSLPGLIPELGSDVLPDPGSPPARRDNLHESTMVNKNGFPSQRVVVGYQGPEGAPPLLADLYLFDETSSSWFLVPPCGEGILTPGSLAYFDPPCLLDHSRAKKNSEDESHQSGSLEVLLLVRAETPSGSTLEGDETIHPLRKNFPPGVYTFVLGTDVSNPG